MAAAPACAQDSLLERLGKAAGVVSPPADPPDFVKASRPAEAPGEIPVFAAPEEPRSRVKSPSELKTMDADLERAGAGETAKPKHKHSKN